MLKKVIAWLLLVVLTAGLAIGGTLAYLTDRDSEANVFTTGDVDISLKEDFTQDSTLIPGEQINKDVQIKNEGPNSAYVWYTYAIPQALDGNLELIYANEVEVSSAEEIQAALADDAPYNDVKIVLTQDIVIDKDTPWDFTNAGGAHFEIHKAKNVVFDMNGHKITVKEDAVRSGKNYAYALFLIRNASFTLIGDGEIEINNRAMAINCWQDSSQTNSVKVYGNVKITSNAHERAGSGESTVYVQAATDSSNNVSKERFMECYLYGGTYDGYALNVANDCGDTAVLYLHEGVRFSDYKENLFLDDLNKGRIKLADGCTLEHADGWYTVVGPNEQVNYGGNSNGNWVNGQFVGTMEKDGITYNVYTRLYNKILEPGETTPMDLTAVKLADHVDITPDGQLYQVVNGETIKIDWNINQNNGDAPIIYVTACAIQTDGFASFEAAYDAFQKQWGNGTTSVTP